MGFLRREERGGFWFWFGFFWGGGGRGRENEGGRERGGERERGERGERFELYRLCVLACAERFRILGIHFRAAPR